MTIKLSVIVPCYNERNRFTDGFQHYYSYLKRQNYSWELIFVNDGSSDQTGKLIAAKTKIDKNVKLITYAKNQGKGYAITQGVKKAVGKYILFTDLDHSVPIETVESFYKYFDKGFQVVIGSRRVMGAEIAVRQHLIRESLGRGFTMLVRLFVDWQVKDATCGFKAFENKIAKRLFQKVSIYDWAFDAELLYLCKKNHIKYAQAPVVWRNVRGSKVSLSKDILRSLIGLLRIRLNDLQKKYS